MQTKTADANLTIYDELLAREYGALVLRSVVGPNLIRAVAIATLTLWTLIGATVLLLKQFDISLSITPPTGTGGVVIINPGPPTIIKDVSDRIRLRIKEFIPPKTEKFRLTHDQEVPDTIVISTKDENRYPDEPGSGSGTGNGSGTGAGTEGGSGIAVINPPVTDTVPEYAKFIPYEDEPVLVVKNQPAYPELARAAHVTGSVVLQIRVNRQGAVSKVVVVKSNPSGLGFEDEAVKAVRSWKFKPALNNQQPVEVWIAQTIKFTM